MSFSGAINVLNRSGESVPMKLETISNRLNLLVSMDPKLSIKTDYVVSKTIASLVDRIKTSEIDAISASICASLIVEDYEYDALASRIMVSSLHKTTHDDLRVYARDLTSYHYLNYDIKILHPKTIKFIFENHKEMQAIIDYNKDFSYNYFGIVTLMNSYLLSYKHENGGKTIKERPQQMLLRTAIGIHLSDINDDGTCSDGVIHSISETYKLLSDKYYTHATPTLFNSGTINHTLSSCYLLAVDDSLENIYQRLTDISKISKFSGGVGIHVSQIRAQGSVISSTIGRSEGLVPMLRVYNESTKYVSQGGGKRKGSTAVYIEPWHSDIESCIMSQKQQGIPEKLCRDLFLAIWMPDLFMQRLKDSLKTGETVMWSLMCPNECKGLADAYGEEFKALYESYEKQKKYRKQVPIVTLWNLIVSTQIETGKPYLMYKDHVNRKCNQNNLGTIKSSNLCVHGDTLILTENGYENIKNLDGQIVKVWNGIEWSPSPVAKTGEQQELLQVATSDGCVLQCTPYHKFYLKDGTIVAASELKEGMSLMTCASWPTTDGDYIYRDESQVPIGASKHTKRQWLTEYIHMNFCKLPNTCRMSPLKRFAMWAETYKKAYEIKLMCNTLGFSPMIETIGDDHYILFSNKDIFYMVEVMRLSIQLFSHTEASDAWQQDIRIVNVSKMDGLHDTYCFNEPLRHMGVFNGLLTSQCSEITIYSDTNQVGVCNLASICLPKFVVKNADGNVSFDYGKLNKVTQRVVINMNKVLDNNRPQLEQARYSDEQHRPIGIGVQGLADVFMLMSEPFDSERSKKVNAQIFETIYYAALIASNRLAQVDGPYASFRTSMAAKGILQFDLWENNSTSKELAYNWEDLKQRIRTSGLRNSLLTCLMPTASTAIIQENCESMEVPLSNLFTRSTLSGNRFQIVNKHLMRDLKKIGLWNSHIRDQLIQNEGSIQSITEIPLHIRNVYKTVFEYNLSSLIDMCADRERFICQSASNNRYIINPSVSKITKMHLYSWKKGLKTSSYYVRCKQLVTGKKIKTSIPSVSFKDTESSYKDTESELEECMSCMA